MSLPEISKYEHIVDIRALAAKVQLPELRSNLEELALLAVEIKDEGFADQSEEEMLLATTIMLRSIRSTMKFSK